MEDAVGLISVFVYGVGWLVEKLRTYIPFAVILD